MFFFFSFSREIFDYRISSSYITAHHIVWDLPDQIIMIFGSHNNNNNQSHLMIVRYHNNAILKK